MIVMTAIIVIMSNVCDNNDCNDNNNSNDYDNSNDRQY